MAENRSVIARLIPCITGVSILGVAGVLMVISMVTLVVGIARMEDLESRQATDQMYHSKSLLGAVLAEIQETADTPPDLAASQGVGSICEKYDGRNFFPAELPGARITVKCFRNEATIPDALGGPRDLNLDGDLIDDFSSKKSGRKMKVVPVELSLEYKDGHIEHRSKMRDVIAPRSE